VVAAATFAAAIAAALPAAVFADASIVASCLYSNNSPGATSTGDATIQSWQVPASRASAQPCRSLRGSTPALYLVMLVGAAPVLLLLLVHVAFGNHDNVDLPGRGG